MRWSEGILEAHLKAHKNKAILATERLKTQNDAKVRQQVKTRLKLKPKPNSTGEEKLILDTEIWMTNILNKHSKAVKHDQFK